MLFALQLTGDESVEEDCCVSIPGKSNGNGIKECEDKNKSFQLQIILPPASNQLVDHVMKIFVEVCTCTENVGLITSSIMSKLM